MLDAQMVRRLAVTEEYLEREIAAQLREIERRSNAYRRGRDAIEVSGRTAVVVDDGIATGGTAVAACRWARQAGAHDVVLAVPVAPAGALRRLAPEADRLVVLETPDPFMAVGEWYRSFGQASDEDVVAALEQQERST